jgi:hypothetical protein
MGKIISIAVVAFLILIAFFIYGLFRARPTEIANPIPTPTPIENRSFPANRSTTTFQSRIVRIVEDDSDQATLNVLNSNVPTTVIVNQDTRIRDIDGTDVDVSAFEPDQLIEVVGVPEDDIFVAVTISILKMLTTP